jgi:hypothetical protein
MIFKKKKSEIPLIELPDDKLRIQSYLPYLFYFEDDKYFLNKDGSISVILEITPPNAIYDKHLDRVFGGLVTIFNHYYPDIILQSFLISTRGVSLKEKTIKLYLQKEKNPKLPNVVKQAISEKIELFQKDFICDIAGINYSAKTFKRLFAVTLITKKPQAKRGILDTLFNNIDQNLRMYEEAGKQDVKKINRVVDTLIDSFRVIGVKAERITPQKFLDYFYPIFNQKQQRNNNNYDKLLPLGEQLINTNIVIDNDKIYLNNEAYGVVSVNAIAGTETNFFFIEDNNKFTLADMLDNFLCTINMFVNPKEKEIISLEIKKKFAFSFTKTGSDIKSNTIKNEIINILEDIYKNNIHLNNAMITFMVKYKDIETLISRLELYGIQCIHETDPVLFPVFLNTLPFFYRPEYDNVLRRTRKLYPHHTADIVSFYPEFQGTPDGSHIYLDRRGNVLTLDCFNNEITPAPHAVVLGITGAGKSFFMCDYILQATREDPFILVIDKGNSYKKLCNLYKGQYVTLSISNPVTINPFYKFSFEDKEQLVFLSNILRFMATGIEADKDYLNREKTGILEESILDLSRIQQEQNKEMTLSDFIEVLKTKGNIGIEIANRLVPFSKKGRYGSFFDGINQFNIENPFTVFEIGQVNDDELLTAWFMSVAYFYANIIQDQKLRGRKKYLIMDEVWRLMGIKSTNQFFVEIVKTYRKHGAQLVTITQDFEDFFGSSAGIAIFNNSPNKFLLMNSANSIHRNANSLMLTPYELDQYISVKRTTNFSECFIKIGDDISGVVRLTPSQYTYWLSTTNDKDNAKLDRYIEKCNGDLGLAIETLLKEQEDR